MDENELLLPVLEEDSPSAETTGVGDLLDLIDADLEAAGMLA
jgi:hypothetical protein